MAQSAKPSTKFWDKFYGPNMGYVEEQYELYKEDASLVDPSLKTLFDTHGAPEWSDQSVATVEGASSFDAKKITSAMRYIDAIRRYGHLEADIYAVGGWPEDTDVLEQAKYGITDEDLKNIPASWLWDNAPANVETGYDVVQFLRSKYTGKVSFEFDHVNNDEERQWFLSRIESDEYGLHLNDEEKKQLLERLIHVEGFEQFLQKTFVGQKRFSIEGLESMVPILDQIVKSANKDKVEYIMMGMAHRGRLAVLAFVLGKPLDKIFSEFHHAPDKELIPSEGSMGINYGWTGDVKYHFGATRIVENDDASTRVHLAHNPSHLEFVNPVVAGKTRAVQDDRSEKGYPEQDMDKATSILIHGDAAFIGEGIVPETMNLSGIKGYRTGGSLHIIANNLIGFTTDRQDSRSTRYTSDLAKGYEIPIIRVNADDPIACVEAIQMAYDYSHTFKKDCVLDLVGYRRYGHNEMDEPRSTQPVLYREIDNHPTVTEIFAKELIAENVVTEDAVKEMKESHQKELQVIYDSMKENPLTGVTELKMPDYL
ncbi:MAG TPA: thiamine pyrophosphate-dependent enzyme, partial [Savagea sp.]